MRNIYTIADTHLGHKNIIKYCNRPFKSVEEMDNTIINNWNNIVSKDDIIYHCGDFAFGTKEQIINYAKQLNGYIILIRGNHERSSIKFYEEECGFEVIKGKKYWTLAFKKNNKLNKYIFSHKPMENIPEDTINIHGHIHNYPLSNNFNPNTHMCVSVEMTNYKPIKLL